MPRKLFGKGGTFGIQLPVREKLGTNFPYKGFGVQRLGSLPKEEIGIKGF
jgi:hypothetical protein